MIVIIRKASEPTSGEAREINSLDELLDIQKEFKSDLIVRSHAKHLYVWVQDSDY